MRVAHARACRSQVPPLYTVIDISAFPSGQLLGLNDRGQIVGIFR